MLGLAEKLGLVEALERGALRPPASSLLTAAWRIATRRSLRRELTCRPDIPVIVVGGATLGGSSKTPLAMACVRELAACGLTPVLVGHAYRARPRLARIVTEVDSLEDVGDEAVLAQSELRSTVARVVVGPSRQSAIDLASRVGNALVIDGVLQTSPRPANLSLLAVDAEEPWGCSGDLPPRGDLRAPRFELLDMCDAVVPVGEPGVGMPAHTRVWGATVVSRGAWLTSGTFLSWSVLSGASLGLITALARPARLLRRLARHGLRPRAVLRCPDHGPLDSGLARRAALTARNSRIDAWLASPKCSIHVAHAAREGGRRGQAQLGAPVATLEHSLVLSDKLVAGLRRLAAIP